MSYTKIWIHCVWATNKRKPILTADKRILLMDHILGNSRRKQIYIHAIGGYVDHLHCLLSLGAGQSLGSVMQLIKGESSHWANQNNLFGIRLEWGEDYYGASLGGSSVRRVREYIDRQEEHHRKMTFPEEYEKFIRSGGFVLG